jgi:LPXTG-motif cell wall-anchored protein
MDTKKIGLIILVIGLLMTLYTGYNYVTREKVMDIGGMNITMDQNHSANWSPFIGLGVMVIGGGIVLFSKNKKV